MDNAPEFIEVRLVVTARVSRDAWEELGNGNLSHENVVGYYSDQIGLDARSGVAYEITVQDVTAKVGDTVFDGDGYEARVASVLDGIATLDYGEFPSDVPPETTE